MSRGCRCPAHQSVVASASIFTSFPVDDVITSLTVPVRLLVKRGSVLRARDTVVLDTSEIVPTLVDPMYTATEPQVAQVVAMTPTCLTPVLVLRVSVAPLRDPDVNVPEIQPDAVPRVHPDDAVRLRSSNGTTVQRGADHADTFPTASLAVTEKQYR